LQTPTGSPRSASTASCAELGIPGGRVAFTVGDGQANGIGVVNADGSGFQVVVEAKDIEGQPHGGTEGPTWMGSRILFDSNRNGGPDDWHLFSVDAGGGTPVQITKGAEGIENHGVLARDGGFIAFAKYLATGDPKEPFGGGGIFVANPDGGHERQVTKTPMGGVDEWPDISPDGRRIAFGRGHVAEGGLYVVNVDGSGLTRIVPPSMEPSRPRWSNDGRRIVFHSNGERYMTESANVWVVNADGSGLGQLTFEKIDGQAFFPTWSPDDRFVLFVHKPRGIPKNDLAVIPSAGGAMCTLWAGTRASGAWESDWAADSTSAIVGTWHRMQTCDELMAAFRAAGLLESHRQWADDLCAETKFPTEHSHFFTADGKFGSYDQNGKQVDDGDYTVVGDELRFPSHGRELGQGTEIVVRFRIEGDVATFDVKVPAACPDPCGLAYFWALSAFASGPWTRSHG
jgi:Tol biopolymer transport system component